MLLWHWVAPWLILSELVRRFGWAMLTWSEIELRERLTERQYQVLSLVAERYSSKEIGQRLNLSYRTVDGYIAEIVLKLEVAGRGDAARLLIAARKGSVENTGVPETVDDQGAAAPTVASPGAVSTEAENVTIQQPGRSQPLDLKHFFAAMFNLPPVGGRRHNMTLTERAVTVGQISLVGMALFAAVVTLSVGVVVLLGR